MDNWHEELLLYYLRRIILVQLSLRQRIINIVGMIVVFFLQIIDNVNREKKLNIGGLNEFKNILLIFICLIFLCEIYILLQNNQNIIFLDEIKNILKLSAVFLILSIYYMQKNEGFNIITLEGIFRILFPLLIAFSTLNVMSLDDIYKFMTIIFVVSFAAYLYIIGDNLTYENILSISLVKSYSPFESTFFSPIAMSFCLFFCYYRKNKLFTILSVMFTFMTFKRIMVFYSLFLLLFGWIFQVEYQIPKWIIFVYKILFFLISIFYINLMLGNIEDIIYKYFGISINSFSMGRAWLMQNIYYNFSSYGFMTSTINFRTMEMDIPQFYVEMGLISVIATVNYITNIAKRNGYNFLIVIFCMLELLTSHWIDIVYFWIVMYITIGCVAYKKEQKYLVKHKLKFKFNYRKEW